MLHLSIPFPVAVAKIYAALFIFTLIMTVLMATVDYYGKLPGGIVAFEFAVAKRKTTLSFIEDYVSSPRKITLPRLVLA